MTYLDDHTHVVWYMNFYTLVAVYHKEQGDKSQIHHSNKSVHQNLGGGERETDKTLRTQNYSLFKCEWADQKSSKSCNNLVSDTV